MSEELKAELIRLFTIEGKGKQLACSKSASELIKWIDERIIKNSAFKIKN